MDSFSYQFSAKPVQEQNKNRSNLSKNFKQNGFFVNNKWTFCCLVILIGLIITYLKILQFLSRHDDGFLQLPVLSKTSSGTKQKQV